MAKKETAIKLFQNKEIRVNWNEEEEKWYFSIVDVISLLTENDFQSSRNYWKVLKHRLKEEGNETVTDCNQLKMRASDGKMRLTDVADTEQMLRLIQSIPSKKAEPFKLWLAKVGHERIEETHDPELAFDRAMKTYLKKGHSKEWINQRLKTIEVRKELTYEWENRGVRKESEYAILTNEITKAWSGHTIKDYKKLKDLKKESLRDNMTNIELILNMLAEATTTEISKKEKPDSFPKNKDVARKGGKIAGNTRKDIEEQIGENVVTSKKAQEIHIDTKKTKKISDKK